MKKAWKILKETVQKFIKDEPMSYGASIAFYTIFSLPAVLIIITVVAGYAFGQEAVTGELYDQIKNLVGPQSANEIQKIIQNASLSESGMVATVIGIATLTFSATTVFISIQNALNSIWGVKAKPQKGWLKLIINRVLSFTLVVTLGFLLLVSLLLEAGLQIFGEFLASILTGVTYYIMRLINYSISLVVITCVFAMVFRVLPDARVKWKDVWMGAFVTTLLFTLGKYLISLYLGTSNIDSTYGAAGSLVLVLVWVYYSSLILLLGAEFTQVYSRNLGRRIQPSSHAVRVQVVEIDPDDKEHPRKIIK